MSNIRQRLKWFNQWKLAELTVVMLACCAAYTNHFRLPNYFQHFDVGTLMSQLSKGCAMSTGDTASFGIFPFKEWRMTEKRSVVCTKSVSDRNSLLQDFWLRPSDSSPTTPLKGKHNAFTQTFTANRNGLSGVALYYAADAGSDASGFTSMVKDQQCKTILVEVALPSRTRSGWNAISFPTIKESEGRVFCFSVVQTKPADHDVFVFFSGEKTSAEKVTSVGQTELNGAPTTQTVIFSPIYSRW